MGTAYPVVTIVLAAMAAFSGLGKLRRDPKIVHIVHEVVGVPLKYFLHLAAREFAGGTPAVRSELVHNGDVAGRVGGLGIAAVKAVDELMDGLGSYPELQPMRMRR